MNIPGLGFSLLGLLTFTICFCQCLCNGRTAPILTLILPVAVVFPQEATTKRNKFPTTVLCIILYYRFLLPTYRLACWCLLLVTHV